MSFAQILSYSLTAILFLTALYCLIRALKTKEQSLYWISSFLTMYVLSTALNSIGEILLRNIFRNFGAVFLILFIHYAFYLDKKSPIIPILTIQGIILILEVIGGILISINGTASLYLYQKPQGIARIVGGGWLFLVSFQGFKKVKNLKIQPHIKLRYILLMSIGITYCLLAIPALFLSNPLEDNNLNNIGKIISSVLAIPLTIIFAICWIMPQFLKDRINQDFEKIQDESSNLSEEDMMKQLEEGGSQ